MTARTRLIQFMPPLILVFVFVAVLSQNSFDWDHFSSRFPRVSRLTSASADTDSDLKVGGGVAPHPSPSDEASFYNCSVLCSETPMMLCSDSSVFWGLFGFFQLN